MSSYTTLVNVDRDTPVKLAHFVSQLLPANSQEFYSECNDLIEKSEVVPLIKKILDQSDFLLAMDRDTGTYCFFLSQSCAPYFSSSTATTVELAKQFHS